MSFRALLELRPRSRRPERSERMKRWPWHGRISGVREIGVHRCVSSHTRCCGQWGVFIGLLHQKSDSMIYFKVKILYLLCSGPSTRLERTLVASFPQIWRKRFMLMHAYMPPPCVCCPRNVPEAHYVFNKYVNICGDMCIHSLVPCTVMFIHVTYMKARTHLRYGIFPRVS